MVEGKAVAGWVLLGVGALLIIVAIVLIIYLFVKKRKNKKIKRSKSQDTFKIVYKVPTANGTTKVSGDLFDGRSVHTLRSESGYKYVVPPAELAPPVIISPPSVLTTANTLPRATSVDHVSVTLPRTGQRFLVPAPNGTLPRILVPVNKRKAKHYKKSSKAQPLFVYDGQAPSVLSAPTYAASTRSVPAYATSARSIPAYATSPRSVTSGNNKYYMYGSTPNLAASHFTQPVLMYDKQKRSFFTDDLEGGNVHVQNWLSSDDRPTSLPGDDTDFARPGSRASSDLEQLNISSLHMRWSPSMRRRLQEMDRREHQEQQERANGTIHTLQHEVPADGVRLAPVHHYTELSEEF